MMHSSFRPARKHRVLLLLIPALTSPFTACNDSPAPDAYGNFEAIEVVVSAQTTGQVESFVPREGMHLEKGDTVALIDTTQLGLERAQLRSQRAAVAARRDEATEQLRVLEVQREIAQRTLERTQRLADSNAATRQQLDQAERDFRVINAQMAAVRAQRTSVSLEEASNSARVAQIAERIARSNVVNPEKGTVLSIFAREGEVVQAGQPLYRIANLDTLTLRAYITGTQLSAVSLGQQVRVNIANRDQGLSSLNGTVTWISSTAEFTPTPVQTRDERADLVYAVKIDVPNPNGVLKIGMPGDVTFSQQQRDAEQKE